MFSADKEVIICVSHGNSIDSVASLTGIAPGSMLIFGVNYGCTTILKSEVGGKWTMVGGFAVAEHLGLENGQMIPDEF